jgi:hypothetical protein
MDLQNRIMKLTAAGTVAGFHGIPFSSGHRLWMLTEPFTHQN